MKSLASEKDTEPITARHAHKPRPVVRAAPITARRLKPTANGRRGKALFIALYGWLIENVLLILYRPEVAAGTIGVRGPGIKMILYPGKYSDTTELMYGYCFVQ